MTKHLDDSSNAHPTESNVATQVASQAASDHSGDQHQRHDDMGSAQSTADKLHEEMPWYRRPTPEMKAAQAFQTAERAERLREAERAMLLLSPLFGALGATTGAVIANESTKH